MTNMISIPSNQMNATPQTIPAQVVLQKQQQQIRAMHPNMVAQQQMIGSNLHQVEFRQPAPANVVLQQNQMQPNQQLQQFQVNSIRGTILTRLLIQRFYFIHSMCSHSSLSRSYNRKLWLAMRYSLIRRWDLNSNHSRKWTIQRPISTLDGSSQWIRQHNQVSKSSHAIKCSTI